MSIEIEKEQCIGCGKCVKVCPGNLIYKDKNNKAFIKYDDQCWGCTACLKECTSLAIKYYLGSDIRGKGGRLVVKKEGDYWDWRIKDTKGNSCTIKINTKESNKY